MLALSRSESLLLLLGDVLVFFVALWLSLVVRYLALPSSEAFAMHLVPFALLSAVWVTVFFIAGLYDKHTEYVQQGLLSTILHAQAINIALAALFFFLFTDFGIAPKTTLLIYLVTSSALLLTWRLKIFLLATPRVRERAIVLGGGHEVEELVAEVNANPRYGFEVVRIVGERELSQNDTFEEKFLQVVRAENVSVVIASARDAHVAPHLPVLFSLTFARGELRFIELALLYEHIFSRVPLTLISHDWFLEYATRTPHLLYDVLKRGIDLVLGSLCALVFLLVLPCVWLAVRLDDNGPLFIAQRRKGRLNRTIVVHKFRTMRANEHGVFLKESSNPITRVGSFLRKTSLDELPQILNILRGDMSLIGPRNDIAGLAERMEQEIPFYAIRTLIKPGITGWAQTHQHYSPGNISPQSVEETRMRLAYDLYYIKHRSLLLDINIALRTFKTLVSRFGISRTR